MISRGSHLALALVLGLSVCSCNEPPPTNLSVAGRVYDPASPRENAKVVIEAGTIQSVEGTESKASNAIFPGHFAVTVREQPTAEDLAAALERGITGLVLLDGELIDGLTLRDYVGTSRHRGPRIFLTGPELTRFIGAKDFAPAKLRLKSGLRDLVAAGVNAVLIDGRVGPKALCIAASEADRQDSRLWLDLRHTGGEQLNALMDCSAPIHAVLTTSESAEEAARVLATGSAPTVLAIISPEEELLATLAASIEPPPRAAFESLPGSTGPDAALPAAVAVARSLGVAQCLGLDDALGRVALGYRADMTVRGAAGSVFVDGVRQQPDAPLLAPLHLLLARWHAEARVDALFR